MLRGLAAESGLCRDRVSAVSNDQVGSWYSHTFLVTLVIRLDGIASTFLSTDGLLARLLRLAHAKCALDGVHDVGILVSLEVRDCFIADALRINKVSSIEKMSQTRLHICMVNGE